VQSVRDHGTRALDGALQKRIRLTNLGALFGALVMLATLPLDLREGTRWMPVIDIISVPAFLAVPFANRFGYFRVSRIGLIVMANVLVLANAVVLGPASGIDLLFLALIAVSFTIFDLRERWALLLGVALSVSGLIVAEVGVFNSFGIIPSGYFSSDYHTYSALAALAILLFALYQVSHANARAERALRLDIAARERAERALDETRQLSITAAKMAALGEMSANVAHEVNNPLAAILLRAERLAQLSRQGRLDTAAVLRTAREISATVERIRRIIDALRSFARQGEGDPLRPEAVVSIVKDTVELCGQRFRMSAIELVVDPIPPDLRVDCRAAEITQILVNLLSNAHDAVERTQRPWVNITVEADGDGPGDDVRIVVTDSGPGIPPEVARRIMEPFFTTKPIGRGTGLGLSLSRGIAETHGGRLELDTHSARTRFVLTLRRSMPDLEVSLQPPAEPPGLHH
jgi:signal transduction histidine kinase